MKSALKFLPILLLLIAVGCGRDNYVAITGYAQGGMYSVKVNLKGMDLRKETLRDSVEAFLTLIDTTFSGYNRNSILSRRNAGDDVAVNAPFRELLALSEGFQEKSEGAFNVYAAPVFDAWGFGFTPDSLPPAPKIREALEATSRREKLNFNAIAQGYTSDFIARFLRRHGAEDYLVDIGEISCRGLNPSRKGWSIGIDTPVDGNNIPGASLSGVWTSDGGEYGLVTSGNYRKFYIRDGKKYAHTIDPRTGYPVEHNLLCATVLAPDATTADALATWFMVVGFENARDIVEDTPGVEACLISSDGTWTSEGFQLKM